MSSVWNRTFINGFLSEVARTNAPLDFFSWHWYGDSPEQLRDTVIQVKSDLAAHSLTGAESICDEWNYMRGTMWVPARREKHIRREFYEKQRNHVGASFVAACMAVMQENGVDLSTHYDGQPHMMFCSIFDRCGIETKTYRAFEAFHKIYQSWAWTGGHADGETDLLHVAMREAREETGIERLRQIGNGAASLEILPVWAHVKRGKAVGSHLHLNVSYLFEADDSLPLRVAADENSAVGWITIDRLAESVREKDMLPTYEKLLNRTNVC